MKINICYKEGRKMNRKTVSGIMLTLLLIGMLALAFNIQPVSAEPKTWYVDDDGGADFTKIQDAIYVANPGDTIYVYNGTYYENVVVNKSVSLIGEYQSNTIIDASGVGSVVQVTANNVTIMGFTIRNSGGKVNGGITLSNVVDCHVNENNITNNFFGIYLSYSSSNTMLSNNITNNSIGISLSYSSGTTLSGNFMNGNNIAFGVGGISLSDFMQSIDVSNLVDGMPVYYLVNQTDLVINSVTHPQVGYLALINSANITVENLAFADKGKGPVLVYTNNSRIANNNITNSGFGIYLRRSSNNTVVNNNITNSDLGIYFSYSSSNTITDNNITNSSLTGIFSRDYSSSNTITNNNITNNDFGIYLFYSSSNTVTNNEITNSSQGIRFYYSSSNTIVNNNITASNQYGIYTRSHSNSNRFHHNNLVGNVNQVYVESGCSNTWDDGYPSGGNYWSDYLGVDEKHGSGQDQPGSDGLGDTPYIIDGNNTDNYPLMEPLTPPDIAATNITLSKTIVSQGYNTSLDVIVENQGDKVEGFNVTAYANATVIQTRYIILQSQNSTIITFTWNTTAFAKGNYTISAYATPLLDETDTDDNTYTDGTILVTIPGDINGDGTVDIFDLSTVGLAYGKRIGQPGYNPYADINEDGRVEARDLAVVCMHYGETDP